MARTKRAKVVSLTQTKAKTREHKENLIETIRESANQYAYVWIFAVSNMRNTYLGEVRKLWTGSKIFFGKLRVIAKALGETPEEEIRPGLGQIAKRLRGNVGLLFTDSPPAEVLDWCMDYRRLDYARMGNRATETIELPAGPVYCRTDPPETLPHNIEPQLRALGMPTQLKHLIVQMAHFRLIPLTYWSAVGAPGDDSEGAVVDVPVSEEDRELIEDSRTGGRKDQEDEMPEDEMDAIEARDQAMMMPPGL